jgi:hypothetical protein
VLNINCRLNSDEPRKLIKGGQGYPLIRV